MSGLVFKPDEPQAETPPATQRHPPIAPRVVRDDQEPHRPRHRRSSSPWKRFKRGVGEHRRKIAVIVALVVSCGGALLLYMLIRPD